MSDHELTDDQRAWLADRSYLSEHRHDLGVTAAELYPDAVTVGGTPLLSRLDWLPAEPVPLDAVQLAYDPAAPSPAVTGTEPEAGHVLPRRVDGTRFGRYSDAVAELAAPSTFENRGTYRLADADLTAGRMRFAAGRYFDGIDVGDSAAHEYAAARRAGRTGLPFRELVGDPCDPARRGINVAVSALTIRHDRRTGAETFLMHRRDAKAVGHAGGMFTTLPVGVFQPAGEEPWNVGNDFSLWRCLIREYAEELLGRSEDYNTAAGPIHYAALPLSARMGQAAAEGRIRAWCLGIGVDPLTLATDLLAVVVVDAELYDELFGQAVADNAEGSIAGPEPFTAETIDRYADHEPTQSASAALLRLAWKHRATLLG